MPEIDDLFDEYLDAVLERNPHVATLLGVHEYDEADDKHHPTVASGNQKMKIPHLHNFASHTDSLNGAF